MKIRRLQITMEPIWQTESETRTFTVEVRTDCGHGFSSRAVIHEDSFQDTFGLLMKDAERRIRYLLKEKTEPADNIV